MHSYLAVVSRVVYECPTVAVAELVVTMDGGGEGGGTLPLATQQLGGGGGRGGEGGDSMD